MGPGLTCHKNCISQMSQRSLWLVRFDWIECGYCCRALQKNSWSNFYYFRSNAFWLVPTTLTCIKSCITASWATSPFSHYNVLPSWWSGTSFSLVLAKRKDFVQEELFWEAEGEGAVSMCKKTIQNISQWFEFSDLFDLRPLFGLTNFIIFYFGDFYC